jgi:hypothetical protein
MTAKLQGQLQQSEKHCVAGLKSSTRLEEKMMPLTLMPSNKGPKYLLSLRFLKAINVAVGVVMQRKSHLLAMIKWNAFTPTGPQT